MIKTELCGKEASRKEGEGDQYDLSICIATKDRARAVDSMLERILRQQQGVCEVVIVDGGSTDDTPSVVAKWAREHRGIRYIRQEQPKGMDRDFDTAVECASGKYCWLMPDDDVLKAGAISAVTSALSADYSLVLVDYEFVDVDTQELVSASSSKFSENRTYGPREMERMFREVGRHATYLGSIVIKRSIWLSRERTLYHGSYHLHTAVIFQKSLPGTTLVLAPAIVSHLVGGTHSWHDKVPEMVDHWPMFVESLAISNSAKREFAKLMSPTAIAVAIAFRGMDYMSPAALRRWGRGNTRSVRQRLGALLASLLPGRVANMISMLYFSLRPRGTVEAISILRLRKSRFYVGDWAALRRFRRASPA